MCQIHFFFNFGMVESESSILVVFSSVILLHLNDKGSLEFFCKAYFTLVGMGDDQKFLLVG